MLCSCNALGMLWYSSTIVTLIQGEVTFPVPLRSIKTLAEELIVSRQWTDIKMSEEAECVNVQTSNSATADSDYHSKTAGQLHMTILNLTLISACASGSPFGRRIDLTWRIPQSCICQWQQKGIQGP